MLILFHDDLYDQCRSPLHLLWLAQIKIKTRCELHTAVFCDSPVVHVKYVKFPSTHVNFLSTWNVSLLVLKAYCSVRTSRSDL